MNLNRQLKIAFIVCCMTSLMLATVTTSASMLWGSPSAAIAVLRGEFIRVDGTIKSFGSMYPHETAELNFLLTNLSRRPVRILGSDASCDCTIVDNIPAVIGPRSRMSIRLRVSLAGKQGSFQQSVRLYTSSPKQQEILLTIRGDVAQASPHASSSEEMPVSAF